MNTTGKLKNLKSTEKKVQLKVTKNIPAKNVKKPKSLFPEDSLTWTQETWEYMNE